MFRLVWFGDRIVYVDKTAGSTIYSDEYSAYQRVFGKAKAFTHKIVVHGKGNYVNGNVHTNNIEGFWNITKDAVCGTYNHVSRKYLQRYCDEVSFRFNNRKVSKGESFCDLFANCMGTKKLTNSLLHHETEENTASQHSQKHT